MKIQVSDAIGFPLDVVFPTFRDSMVEIAPYLSNIEGIEVHERTADGTDMLVISTWEAKVKFPGPLEKIVPQDKRKWRDIANWHEHDHSVHWQLEMPMLSGGVKVGGHNRFVAEGDNTRLLIDGELTIDPSKIPGVPTIVAKRLVPTIEKFVVSTVQKNLAETNRAVERFLAEKK